MRKLYVTCFVLAIATAALGQRIATGDWQGMLDVGVKLRLLMHIKQDSTSNYTATFDSPDQGAKGIPASDVRVTKDSVIIKATSIGGMFAGAFTNDTTIAGKWWQGGMSLPLTLVKGGTEMKRNRPQTPKPPFSYASEDVEFDNADKTIHFGGTLTYPSSGGKFPVALMLTGSGQQDRDETIFEHKPFAVIADYLTKLGFAILRVDDRGVGKTTGSAKDATTQDFAYDAEAALAYLKTRREIDPAHIGLIGHSEGGLIAELLASKRKDIGFVVLLAAPGEKGSDLLADQNEAVLKSEGVPADVSQKYKSLFLDVINLCLKEKDTVVAFKKAMGEYDEWKKSLSKDTLTGLGFTDDEAANKIMHRFVMGFSEPWMKFFLSSNGAKLLEQTSAKVLALNGEKDIQVLPQPNLAGIEAALKKGKSRAHEVKLMPGLNHLFQHCDKCTVAEYGELEETFSPDALAVMGEWLKKNVQNK